LIASERRLFDFTTHHTKGFRVTSLDLVGFAPFSILTHRRRDFLILFLRSFFGSSFPIPLSNCAGWLHPPIFFTVSWPQHDNIEAVQACAPIIIIFIILPNLSESP
jgi:hypothetical protein